MGKIHPTDIKFMVVLVLCLSMAFPISANDFLFTSIDTSHGLSDNQIRYILQLPDGRMVFTTTQNVNLYDGANFTSLQPTPEYIYPLKQYKGFYHVYLSGDSLLWIKDYQRLMCINLHNERYIANLDSVFQQKGMQHPIEDLFADERGLVWVISHGELLQPELSFRLKLSEDRGTIQDLTADEESLYLFHDTVENNIKFGCPEATHEQVVAAASEEGGVLTNGMSYHARDGKNANAAVVVSVGAEDFAGDPRRAIAFQRELEAKAYAAGRAGGEYSAPAENVQSFLEGKGQLNIGRVQPTYDRGVAAADLGALLPQELAETLRAGLRAYERKIAGYTASEAILTGLETRTSSPVRLKREETLESAQLAGLYPCGEGAGYAGGIMSAAVDGLRVARAIIGRYAPAEG